MSSEGQFCRKCGSGTKSDDLFCRRCGASLAQASVEPSVSTTTPDQPGGTRRLGGVLRSRKTLLAGIALLALLVAGGVVAAATILGSDDMTAADAERARADALRERLFPPFEDEMQARDSLFVAERQYLTAMSDARRAIRKYQQRSEEVRAEVKRIDAAYAPQREACIQYVDVACPNPSYPDYPSVPDIDANIEKLRAVSRRLDQLRAEVLAFDPPAELRVIHAQLLAAIDALRSDATHNADVFTEAVIASSEGEEGGGGVDKAKISTLRGESALPAIRQTNRAALSLIRTLRIPVQDYDVPGGHDLDPNDHSTAL